MPTPSKEYNMQSQISLSHIEMPQKNNACSRLAWNFAKKTFSNRKQGRGNIACKLEGGFANYLQIGSELVAITSDGIGSKVELAERMQQYNTLGFDLVAMVADDLAAQGFEPCSISNILDVDYLNENIIIELMTGLEKAAHYAKISVTGGETAVLESRIDGYGLNMHFNWCATALGILPLNAQPITGENITNNDKILACFSPGLRSNGFTLAMSILQQKFGKEWHLAKFDNQCWGEILLTPSVIYSPLTTELQTLGINIHGIAHITGGGIPANLGRILKYSSLGAVIDSPFPLQKWQQELLNFGKLSLSDGWENWNMGHGMLLICPASSIEKVKILAEEMHYPCKEIGFITANNNSVTIGEHKFSQFTK